MSFVLKNGALEGVNVWDSIARAYAAVKGQVAPPPAPARTEIANLHGSANIVNGVLSNKDFAALLPFLSLGGEGKLDLADMTVDYNLKGKVTGTPRPAPGQDLSGLKGLTVPLHITGTLSNLNVRPDLGGVAKAKVDEALDKKKDELKKKAQDKLQDLLGSSSSGG
jgi:AsmA protein